MYDKVKCFLQLCVSNVLYVVLHILWIFPVKKKRIFFMTYDGQYYTCNPKYIFEYLHEKYGDDYEYIWCLNKEDLMPEQKGCRVIHGSFAYMYFLLTSNVLITNTSFSGYIPYRKNQLLINTWHGGGAYKKVGLTEADKSQHYYLKRILGRVGKKVTFISACKRFSEVMSKDFFVDYAKFLPIGLPRNDVFFNTERIQKNKEKVHHLLNIPSNTMLVLYAPTFRGTTGDIRFNYTLDTKRIALVLEHFFQKKTVFLFRKHRDIMDVINQDIIDVSGYADMQELLCATDVLISDYSSCMWDFSFLKRPCFIFAPDLGTYKIERDFYTPIEQWPFPIAETNENLAENIRSFSFEKYCNAIHDHHISLGSYERGEATQLICEKINEYIQNT